jgi:hypothetical protein
MPVPLPLQTALISAATAAVVTLVLDVLIRPYLEARKDRIVSLARDRRDLIESLRGGLSQIGHTAAIYPTDKDKLEEVIQSATYQIARVQSISLPDRTSRACVRLLLKVRGEFIAHLVGLQVCERTIVDPKNLEKANKIAAQLLNSKGVQLVGITGMTLQLTTCRRWQVLKYRRLLAKAESMVSQQDEPDNGADSSDLQSTPNDHST